MLCGREAELEVLSAVLSAPSAGAERGTGRSGASLASGRPHSWLMSFDRSWPSDRT